jgi:hypothetical protein
MMQNIKLHRIGLLCFLLGLALAGCGGGGGDSTALTHVHFVVVSSDAGAAVNQPSVGTFDEGDQANTAPEIFLNGAQTGLDGGVSQGLAISTNNQLFIANTQLANITVYPQDSTGNVMPTATIAGASTGLMRPVALATANGKLYVSDAAANAILIFSTGDSGNVAPMTTIAGPATTLNNPGGIALDGNGNIFVANTGGASVLMFASAAAGDTAPTSTISGPATGLVTPAAVALDMQGNVLVDDDGGGSAPDAVLFFSTTSNGNAAPNNTISGAATMLNAPRGIAKDRTNQTVVVNSGSDSIVVFPAGASGNQSPNEMIQGSATMLSSPAGLAVVVVPGPP